MLITNRQLPSIWEYSPCGASTTTAAPVSSPPPVDPPPDPPPTGNNDNNDNISFYRYFTDADLTVAGLLVVTYPTGYTRYLGASVVNPSGFTTQPDEVNLYTGYLTINMDSYRPLIGRYQVTLELKR